MESWEIESLIRKDAPTIIVSLYISGPYEQIAQECQKYCLDCGGLCVNIKKLEFIYTGGRENGALIELLNYPRFPTTIERLKIHANKLGLQLLEITCMKSFLIVAGNQTTWVCRPSN